MSTAPDDFGGLADLFMGDAAARRGAGARGGTASGVNATRGGGGSVGLPRLLLVGNVPTLAGIWIAQYADQCARADGPVALVRLDGPATRGEVYRSEGRAMPADAGAWLERASAFARRWIVCVDSLTDPALVLDAGGEIVLLTGTDETAIAGARRTIEGLAEVLAARGGGGQLAIGLAVVGCAADVAEAAVRAMDEWASGRALGIRLRLAAHAQRVDRVESSGPVPLSMLGGLDAPSAIEMIAMAMQGNPARKGERDVPRLRIGGSEPAAPVPLSRTGSAAAAAPVPLPATPVQFSAAAAAPTAPAAAATQAVATADPGDLRSLFPNLQALAFHCPDAPKVHLCASARGLHLIAGPSSGADASAADLRVAAAWARAHWELLCAAVPQLAATGGAGGPEGGDVGMGAGASAGASARLVEHLVLSNPAQAVGLHRSGLMLHAVVEFEVDGRTIRRRVDLNTEQTAN